MPAAPLPLAAMTRNTDDERRRLIGLILIGAALLLFVIQIAALALGWIEVSGLIFLVYVAGWFALRSYQRRNA